MGLEGGRVAYTGAKETPACRPPEEEENPGKPLAGAAVAFRIVELVKLSWFPRPWETLPDADCGRASEAREG